MAGVLQKAERKAKAVDSINQSAAALVEHFKLDIEPLAASKYPEYAELDRLDYASNVLSAILEKTKPQEKSNRAADEAAIRLLAYAETEEQPAKVEAPKKAK